MKGNGRFGIVLFGGAPIAQHRTPLVREVVGVVVARQQAIDQTVMLFRVLVGDERPRLLPGGQPSGNIDSHAPEEGGVVTRGRWRQAQILQLLEDRLVDEIPREWQVADRRTERDADPQYVDVRLKAGHDGDSARNSSGGEQAGRGDRGHLRIVRLELGQTRDVDGRTIAEVGDHDHLLCPGAIENPAARQHLEFPHDRGVGWLPRRPLPDPAAQQQVAGEPFSSRLPPPWAI